MEGIPIFRLKKGKSVENGKDAIGKYLKEKIWSFIKQKAWYLLVLIICTIYVLINISHIKRLDDASLDSVIFVVWIFLILLPFFSEFEFLGVKIKREVQNAVEKSNEEIKESIKNLQVLVSQTNVTNSPNNNINVNNYNGLSDSEKIIKLINATKKEEISNSKTKEKAKVDCSAIKLFKVMFCIEKEMNTIIKMLGSNVYRNMTFTQKTTLLHRKGIIQDQYFYELLIAVEKIANRGMHGECLEKKIVDLLVDQAYPLIMNILKTSKKQIKANDK